MSPQTVWLASYPKSGNTWMRAMLRPLTDEGDQDDLDINALGGGPIASGRGVLEALTGFAVSDLTVGEIDLLRPVCDTAFDADLSDVRFRKIHDALRLGEDDPPIVPPAASRAAIYIVRDPRDVAVSYAHHNAAPIEKTVAFLGEPGAAVSRSRRDIHQQVRQRMGSWSEHVRSWLDQDLIPVLTVRYEDIKADAIGELGRVTAFAGLDVGPERLAAAVEGARFERLREKEAESGFHERPKRATPFFRRGQVGGWRDELPAELAARVEADHAAVMDRLGYAREHA